MVMTLTAQVFPKMSSNHKVQKHTGVANIHIGVGSPGIFECVRLHLTDYVIASVCVLELVSTTSSWAKATKTEQHNETLHAKNFTPLLYLRCTVLLQAQLGPACRSDHNEDNHLAANVNGHETDRKKKAIKHARKANMPKQADEINVPEHKTCRRRS